MSDAMFDGVNPRGVIAIVTSPNGHVIATAANFDQQGFGGWTLWESQCMRVADAVGRSTMLAYASNDLVAVMDKHAIGTLMKALMTGGARLTYRAIGWPDDVTKLVAERGKST